MSNAVRHGTPIRPFERMLLPLLASTLALQAPSAIDVRSFGPKGDGVADDTKAFQAAMDSLKPRGGTVSVPVGNYRFAGTLSIPQNVTLQGAWQSVPAHNGIRDAGLPKPTDDGTTFLVESGEGTESGAPFLTLNANSTLKGVVIYYPKQDPATEPKPYPYAIAMRGKNPAVLDVELLNPYNGIDASQNERHLIRNVQGQPLRRGVFVDSIYDIGRIENVHFNPWWSMKPKLLAWQQANGEAFIFGRSDWQYVLNTFCFGYNVGYRFAKTKNGVCNGNFLGIGADDCFTAVVVEDSAPFGLLITNGEFVSFHGPDPTMVSVEATHTGAVRFVNCAFWGPCNQIARVGGKGTVGFSDCTFVQWDQGKQGRPAIDALSGTILVRGGDFRENKLAVRLGPDVAKAIVTDCVAPGRFLFENRSKGQVKVANNLGE
jgi:hypothetical protein